MNSFAFVPSYDYYPQTASFAPTTQALLSSPNTAITTHLGQKSGQRYKIRVKNHRKIDVNFLTLKIEGAKAIKYDENECNRTI